ncbi:MAG TPA: O-antigen ligase [Leptolyngbyaceae cyanobacterium]
MAKPQMAVRINYVNPFLSSIVRLSLAIEKWFAVALYFYFTEPFLALYAKEGYKWTDRVSFYLEKLLLLIVICLLLARWKQSLLILSKGKLLLLFVGITIISTLWSDFPSDTQKQAMSLAESTLFGVYFASRYSFKEQTRMITLAFVIASIFSILYVFGLPKFGITQVGGNAGNWRGIFVHKNTLGRMMVIAGLFFLTTAFSNKRNWMVLVCLGIAVQLILGTNSKSALVSFIFLIAILPLYRIFRWNSIISIPLYIIVVLTGGTAAQMLADNWNAALASIDKDPNLNGRIPIWQIVIERIQERPWLGYGYDGFWHGWEGKWSASLWRTITWLPDQAHNGFLDVVLELGLVGGIIFAILFGNAIFRSVEWIRLNRTLETFWPLAYMTYYVLMNMTQSILVTPYTFVWLIFVMISLTPVVDIYKNNEKYEK